MASFRPISTQMMVSSPPGASNIIRQSTIHPMKTLISSVQAPVQMASVPIRQIIVESPEKRNDEDDVAYRRLEEELDAWRRKYFALETVHQRCSGYEDRLESMEGRIKILRDDNRRLNQALKDKINELEKKRVDFYQVEIENHDLKMSRLQVQRLTDILSQRTQELEDARKKNSDLEGQLSALSTFELTLKEYENRINLLNQEVQLWRQRYAQLDADRIKGLEDWRSSSEVLRTSQYEDLRKSGDVQKNAFLIEVQNLRAQVERLQQENDELKRKLHDLEVQSYGYIAKKQDLEARVKQQKQLSDRLQTLVDDKTRENEQLKIKLIKKQKGVPAD